MTYTKIKWTVDEYGDLNGVGEHATYKIHQLRIKKTGCPDVLGDWLLARKIGVAPLKIIGGPYDCVEKAQERAQALELCL